jgi:hypothetical protein
VSNLDLPIAPNHTLGPSPEIGPTEISETCVCREMLGARKTSTERMVATRESRGAR